MYNKNKMNDTTTNDWSECDSGSDWSECDSEGDWSDCEETNDITPIVYDEQKCQEYVNINKEFVCKQKALITNKNIWACKKCGMKYDKYRKSCINCCIPSNNIINNIINDKKFIKCKECDEILSSDEIDIHKSFCGYKLHNTNIINGWHVDLTANQKKSLRYIHNKTRILSDKAKPNLFERLSQFTREQVERMLLYVAYDLPIIIHFRQSPQMFMSERYKNCYENVAKPPESVRHDAEVKLFGNIYDSFTPRERVKYGTLKIGKKRSATMYGRSYFKLKDLTTRWRCTFTIGDSFGHTEASTLQYCCHNLLKINKHKLIHLVNVANGIKDDYSETSYTEIQIHGDIFFNRDIEYIYTGVKKTNCMNVFGEKNNIKILTMEQ